MAFLDPAGPNDHEQVVFCQDRSVGLRAIIAVHSTRLGPALGGTRFYPFATEEEALTDVMRLARAMSYKSAAAGLDFGGGKAVVIGDPRRDATDPLLRRYGQFVNSLGGRYITTEDVGVSVTHMNLVREETPYVTGTAIELGGSGDPSDATGWGVFCAMRMLARRLWNIDSLEGRHVAIQGVGKVGSYVAGHLAADGCRLTVADVTPEAADRAAQTHSAAVVSTDEIHHVECDIFAPCALGGAINLSTIPELRCEAIAGCANNQLASSDCAEALAERGILYAPDYIVNAGGVINIAYEVGRRYDRQAAFAHVARITETVERVLDLANAERITTAEAADRIAEERLRG